MNPRKLFHYISYLQYPLILVAFIFYVPFIRYAFKGELDLNQLNYVLIFFGVALSFSTLQDTTKTQNRVSKKIWQNPRKGKITLGLIFLLAISLFVTGFIILFQSNGYSIEAIAIGIIVLGVGLLGLLKTAIELFENHRVDKN